jgi:hypothetical protein
MARLRLALNIDQRNEKPAAESEFRRRTVAEPKRDSVGRKEFPMYCYSALRATTTYVE